jgi:hypothetical protein
MFNVFDKFAAAVRDLKQPRPDYPWNYASYPLELDTSQRITRFETGGGYWPWPYLSGFFYEPVAETNNAWLLQAQGQTPFGPNVTTVPMGTQYSFNPPLSKFFGG